MTKSTLNKVSTQQSKLESKLNELQKKERKIYEALAALINFINGKKHQLKLCASFSKFKKDILNAVAQLEIKKNHKNMTAEPKFNVKHYERAIIYASDASYRNMAIQAASKDLNREALGQLVISLGRDCHNISKCIKELNAQWRQTQAETNDHNVLDIMVEPVVDDETTAISA